MHFSTAIVLAGVAGLAATHPVENIKPRELAAFPAGTTFDINLNQGDSKASPQVGVANVAAENFQAVDIDLFDTDASTIADLKNSKIVVCYFSAGSREDWRPDANLFGEGDTGQGLDGWADETWVNVTSENVRSIMQKRIELAAQKGCNAIDPDNVDGFSENQDGFGYDMANYVDYVKFMSSTAQQNNLAIGLKNAIDMIPDVINDVHFAVNEQCHEYSECDQYRPMTDADKAVFNIEYGTTDCSSPSGVRLSQVNKPADQDLNTWGGACPDDTGGSSIPQPVPGNSSSSSSAAPAPTSNSTSSEAPSLSIPTQPSTASGSAPSLPPPNPQPSSTSASSSSDFSTSAAATPLSTIASTAAGPTATGALPCPSRGFGSGHGHGHGHSHGHHHGHGNGTHGYRSSHQRT